MGRRLSDGKAVDVAVPQNTTIEAGKFYALGGVVGMAMQGVITGAGETAKAILEVDFAEYAVKQTGAAFAKGAAVDFTGGVFVAAVANSGDLFGVVTKAADGAGSFWVKRTNVANN